jgi:dienelactone hydrolase
MKNKTLFFLWLQLVLFGYVHAQTWTPAREEELRHKIRATLFIPEKLPELKPVVHGKFSPAPGVIAERITYTTLLGLRVTAILYLPQPMPAGKIPALIVVNGHGGDKYAWYSFYSGILYAKAGAAVLTYDPIGEGERNIDRKSETRAHDVPHDPRELGCRMGGLMMTDLMQAVSYLSQRPEVDPKRIGAMGYSLGSFVVGMTGAVETRLHAAVLVGGGSFDGPGGVWDNNKPMCVGIPYQSLLYLGNRPKALLDRPAVLYALHAARGPALVYNGIEDSTVAIPRLGGKPFFDDIYQRTAQLRGSSKGLFDYDFTEGAHRPNFVTKPVALWLEKQLDFPNWTEADIQAMPVTHISEWAQKNGVEMDPMYSSEIREGGTLALGDGIPPVSRETLNVFTPRQWQKEKDKLIYESWLKAARAQLSQSAW